MSTPGPDRSTPTALRIFVSSTFRDFDLERDALRRVEARLRERLRPTGTTVTLVDLRWGVFSTAEEGERELDVLAVCLEEVARTRPLFLGLLGDRYGWVPDPGTMRSVARRHGLDESVVGRSVTDLEIELGVLGRPDSGPGAVFLFRDVLPGPGAPLADPPGSPAADALADLKRRIDDSGVPVVHYPVEARDGTYSLGDFEGIATDAIWAIVEPTIAASDPDGEVEQLHRGRQRELLSGHHDFGTLSARLAAHVGQEAGTFTVVHGATGSGTSTALAHAVRQAEEQGHAGMFHCFSLGAGGAREDLLGRLERLAGRPGRTGGFATRLRDALTTLGTNHDRFVLAVDALHDGRDDADACLSWLPDPLPSWLHVVVTTGG